MTGKENLVPQGALTEEENRIRKRAREEDDDSESFSASKKRGYVILDPISH